MLLNLIGHMCLFGYEISGKEIELDLTKKSFEIEALGFFRNTGKLCSLVTIQLKGKRNAFHAIWIDLSNEGENSGRNSKAVFLSFHHLPVLCSQIIA